MRPPCALILRAAASHIMPGPLRGYWKLSIRRLDGIGVGFGLAGALTAAPQRALEPVDDGRGQIEALDALRRPIGGNLVARHAPHFLGVGLEENLEQPLAELVAHPFMESARRRDGKNFRVGVGRQARRAGEHAELEQRFEGLERVGEELAVVVDARQPRPRDEIVGQDLLPQRHDLLRFGEEAVAADVEQEALVVDGAADAADIDRVALDDEDGPRLLGQAIGGGEAGGPGADHEHFGIDAHVADGQAGLCRRQCAGGRRTAPGPIGDERACRRRRRSRRAAAARPARVTTRTANTRIAHGLRGGGDGGVAHGFIGRVAAAAIEGQRAVEPPGHQRRDGERNKPRQQRMGPVRDDERKDRKIGDRGRARRRRESAAAAAGPQKTGEPDRRSGARMRRHCDPCRAAFDITYYA